MYVYVAILLMNIHSLRSEHLRDIQGFSASDAVMDENYGNNKYGFATKS